MERETNSGSPLQSGLGLLLGILVGVGLLALVLIVGSPLAGWGGRILNALFAWNSVQALWYMTRAAGLVAYLLLWLATAWGIAVSSKIFDPVLGRMFTFDFHQFLSLLAIGFVVLHVGVLLADRYLPFTVAEVLVPFIAPYRPLWVGVGVIGLYLILLVTITFYIRRWIGTKTFRMVHLASYLAWLSAAVHGLTAGTDSVLPAAQLMYAGTTLVVVFLTVYRIFIVRPGQPRAADRQHGSKIRSVA